MIKVILREDITSLGKAGEVKEVKDGFARNFLLPKNLALLATKQSLKQIEAEQKRQEAKRVLEKKKAEGLCERLKNLSITIAVEINEEEKLYGSLTSQDIARAISAEGIEIDKKSIVLDEPIKDLGIYDLDIRLRPDVTCKVKVWVVKK